MAKMNPYKVLRTIKKDATMALSGDWDRSDGGFEAQIELIDEALATEKDTNPRPAHHDELAALLAWLDKQRGGEISTLENPEEEYANAAIAVWDDYITDGPCYCGKVMVVVWPGSPSFHNVFTFDAATGELVEEVYEFCTCRS